MGAGAEPLDLILAKSPSTSLVHDTSELEDGLVESLWFLLFHDDYSKPQSEEHILDTMLTKAYLKQILTQTLMPCIYSKLYNSFFLPLRGLNK